MLRLIQQDDFGCSLSTLRLALLLPLPVIQAALIDPAQAFILGTCAENKQKNQYALMLFLVRHRLSGSKQQKLTKYMRRRKCPRLSLPLSIFLLFS